MTIRKLLVNLALQVLCVVAGGIDVGVALDAAVDVATNVADVLAGTRRLDPETIKVIR